MPGATTAGDRAVAPDVDAVPAFARGPVVGALIAVAAVLTASSWGYGYERDELYFRLLRPAWGYVDQPPLTPLLVHGISRVVDTVWAIRVPATVCTVLAVLAVALLTRELGGGRAAQALSAWGFGFAAMPLALGHTALTAAIDMPFWPAIALAIARAQLRRQPRWWLAAGVLVGVDLLDKVLVVAFLVALVAGIVIGGPRGLLRSPWVWGAVGLALLVGLPTIVYQVAHGFPQLDMGAHLSADNGGQVRVQMWWFLALVLGPPLTVIWVCGLVALWRRPAWRPVRFLGAGFPVLLLAVFAMGSQVYYPLGGVAVLWAAGCEPTVRWWSRGRGRRAFALAWVALNAAVSAVLALPLVPVDVVGSTPLPSINQVVADSIGWSRYATQVGAVVDALPPDERAHAVVFASNYGEAGAVDRFLPGVPVYSGQNALWDQARPPPTATVVVVVGGQYDDVARDFARCTVVDHLDNGVDVDNEEQGEPVGVCRDPLAPWDRLWPGLRHLS